MVRAFMDPEGSYFSFQEHEYCHLYVRDMALCYAGFLRSKGLSPGGRVCILLNNGAEFFYAFFGVLFAGGIAVPLSPKSSCERVERILDDCQAGFVIASHEDFSAERGQESLSDKLRRCLIFVSEFSRFSQHFKIETEPAHSPAPEDIAFLQYTSGTTGLSKGVALSHKAILANIKALLKRMEVHPERDILSSFMPLYHDMGIIGFALSPLYSGAKLILIRQDISNLYNWLRGISQYRVTITGCPNSVLYLTTRVVSNPGEYDLSSLRMMICGSEPIYPEVVQRFETQYHVPNVVTPAYGLAEISLCATMTAPGKGMTTDQKGIVSCGRPLDGVEIRIASETGETNSGINEILIKTPSTMRGYYAHPELDHEVFQDGYLRTGDLGYLGEDGELYVYGREKNIIIREGENFAPQELEDTVMQLPEVRLAAVIGVPIPEIGNREDIVLVVEVSNAILKKPESMQSIHDEIQKRAKSHCQYHPDKVYFTRRGAIPFSPNGKMQHQILKTLLLSDDFKKNDPVYCFAGAATTA